MINDEGTIRLYYGWSLPQAQLPTIKEKALLEKNIRGILECSTDRDNVSRKCLTDAVTRGRSTKVEPDAGTCISDAI